MFRLITFDKGVGRIYIYLLTHWVAIQIYLYELDRPSNKIYRFLYDSGFNLKIEYKRFNITARFISHCFG